MSRRESFGGGHSSLGNLFGSDDKKQNTALPATPVVYAPPYGIDTSEEEKPPYNPSSSENRKVSYNSRRSPKGLNSGNNITVSNIMINILFPTYFYDIKSFFFGLHNQHFQYKIYISGSTFNKG